MGGELSIEIFDNGLKKLDYLSHIFESYEDDFVTEFGPEYEEKAKSYLTGYSRKCLVAYVDDEPAGVLVFDVNETRDIIEEYCPCVYINFILVENEYRRSGLACEMIQALVDEFALEDGYPDVVGFRTWVDKDAMRGVAEDMGFKERAIMEDGGYDRVYYTQEFN